MARHERRSLDHYIHCSYRSLLALIFNSWLCWPSHWNIVPVKNVENQLLRELRAGASSGLCRNADLRRAVVALLNYVIDHYCPLSTRKSRTLHWGKRFVFRFADRYPITALWRSKNDTLA